MKPGIRESWNIGVVIWRETHNISCGPGRAMNTWKLETMVEVDFTVVYTT
jgi:hypothetical protein